MTLRRLVGAATAVVLVAGLGLAGTAALADPSATPKPTKTEGPGWGQLKKRDGMRLKAKGQQPTDRGQHPGRGHGMGKGKGLGGGRVLHGEYVVRTDTGYERLAVQQGVVTAASASSVTIRSADAFSRAYAVTADTLLRVAGAKPGAMSDVKPGMRAHVLAVVGSGTPTARRLVVRPADADDN